jgi:hypothetical protein
MENKKLRIAGMIFSLGLITYGIYCAFVLIFRENLARQVLNAYPGAPAIRIEPYVLEVFKIHVLLIACLGIGSAIMGLYIVWSGFVNRDKWSLVALLLGGGLCVGVSSAIHWSLGQWNLVIADSIGMTLFGIALTIAGGEFFRKN